MPTTVTAASLAHDAGRLRAALSRRGTRRALLIAGALALCALAAWGATRIIHPSALQAAFAHVSWPWVGVAAAAYVASQLSSALVWSVGLSAGGLGGVERRHVLSAHWIGRGACELLPAQLGETARLAAILRHPVAAAGGGWRIAGSVGAFKVIEGLVTFIVVTMAVAVMPLPAAASGLRWVALGVLVGTGLFLLGGWRLGPARIAACVPGPLRSPARAFAAGAVVLTCRRETLRAVGLQLAAICGRVLMIAALLHAFGLPPSAAILVLALMVLSGLIPISPGGVGVREAALVPVLVATYGLGTAPVLAFSLGVQATALCVSLAGAGAALLVQRIWPPGRIQASL